MGIAKATGSTRLSSEKGDLVRSTLRRKLALAKEVSVSQSSERMGSTKAQQQDVRKAVDRLHSKLRKVNGIRGVGLTYTAEGLPVIQVYSSVSREELPKLPARSGGYPVVVRPSGRIVARASKSKN
jgi:hypothetical protein